MTTFRRETERVHPLHLALGALVVAATVAGHGLAAWWNFEHPAELSRLFFFFASNLLTFFALTLGFFLMSGVWGERFRLVTTGLLSAVLSLVLIFVDYVIIYNLAKGT
jgi:hypothetical protein